VGQAEPNAIATERTAINDHFTAAPFLFFPNYETHRNDKGFILCILSWVRLSLRPGFLQRKDDNGFSSHSGHPNDQRP